MKTVVYVLSNPRIEGEYKVGIHSGTIGKLYSRYSTSIHDVKIHLVIEDVAAKEVELAFQKRRDDCRIKKKHSGRPSEWYKMELETIIIDLMMILLSGRKYGLVGQEKIKITELKERVEKKVRIIGPKTEASDSETSSDSSTSSSESV